MVYIVVLYAIMKPKINHYNKTKKHIHNKEIYDKKIELILLYIIYCILK